MNVRYELDLFFFGGGGTNSMGIMSKDGTLPNVKIISSETIHTDM
jgi:hypothetical protein